VVTKDTKAKSVVYQGK